MLKKILKRIDKEIEAAKDYVDQAFKVKNDRHSLSDLFIELAKEEIIHAEKLIKEGNSIMSSLTEPDEFIPVWKWMCHKNTGCINDLNVKINHYRSY